jgi:hypothetical protein
MDQKFAIVGIDSSSQRWAPLFPLIRRVGGANVWPSERRMRWELLSTLLLVMLGAASCFPAQAGTQGNAGFVNVSGNWLLSWEGRRGTKQVTLQIRQQGPKLSGILQAMGRSVPLTGSVQRNEVLFSVSGKQGFREFKGTVDADRMNGTTSQGRNWTAIRQ